MERSSVMMEVREDTISFPKTRMCPSLSIVYSVASTRYGRRIAGRNLNWSVDSNVRCFRGWTACTRASMAPRPLPGKRLSAGDLSCFVSVKDLPVGLTELLRVNEHLVGRGWRISLLALLNPSSYPVSCINRSARELKARSGPTVVRVPSPKNQSFGSLLGPKWDFEDILTAGAPIAIAIQFALWSPVLV